MLNEVEEDLFEMSDDDRLPRMESNGRICTQARRQGTLESRLSSCASVERSSGPETRSRISVTLVLC